MQLILLAALTPIEGECTCPECDQTTAIYMIEVCDYLDELYPELDKLEDALNKSGYELPSGLHTKRPRTLKTITSALLPTLLLNLHFFNIREKRPAMSNFSYEVFLIWSVVK